MADFCRQCAIELFEFDSGDLRGLHKTLDLSVGHGFGVICEGCGYTNVDHMGQCVSDFCLCSENPKHKADRKFHTWAEVEAELARPDTEFHLSIRGLAAEDKS